MSRVGGRSYPTAEVYEDRERDYYSSSGRRRPTREHDDVEVDVRTDHARRQPEFLREDYGRTSNAGPMVLREDRYEDDHRRRKPYNDYEQEELVIRSRRPEPERSRGPPSRYERDDIEIDRETTTRSHRGGREREDVELDVRRDDWEKSSRRGNDRDDLSIHIRERSRGPPRREELEEVDIRERSRVPSKRETDKEEIVIRRGEGRPKPIRDVSGEDLIIRREDVDDRSHRRREHSTERINIDIRHDEDERPPPRPRSRMDREEIDIRITDDERRRRKPDADRNTLVVRERSQERSRSNRPIAREREDYYFRRRSPERPRETEKEEIIIRRHMTPSPPPAPSPPPPEPEPEPELLPITRPPIHQEIITHHRHIDHGVIRAPPSHSSSSSPSPPPKRREREKDLEVEIRRRDARGNVTEEDFKFTEDDRRDSRRERVEEDTRSRYRSKSRRRSRSRSAAPRKEREREREREANVEVNAVVQYNQNSDRRMMAPVPPQPPAPPKPKEMWTEITKDLVTKEAIEYAGFAYEETADFFYVIEYLRYEDVTRLVELSEELHRDRRERIEQIGWERKDPRLPEPRPPEPPRLALGPPEERRDERRRGDRGDRGDWDERIYEREVIYEDGTRRRYRV